MLSTFLGLVMFALGVLEIYMTKQAVDTYQKFDQPQSAPFKLWGLSYGFYIGVALIVLSLGPVISGIKSMI